MKLTWEQVAARDKIYLYAGDLYHRPVESSHLVCLSLVREDEQHIIHDICKPLPLDDNSVYSYQSEDVFEHIEYDDLVPVIDDIYRVLQPGGLFRLSLPDYRCDVLRDRSEVVDGVIIHDPVAGGSCVNPEHLWFPVIETVLHLFIASKFRMLGLAPLHFYDVNGDAVMQDINYSKGYIARTPDHDKRVQSPRRPMSIVIDAYKDTL